MYTFRILYQMLYAFHLLAKHTPVIYCRVFLPALHIPCFVVRFLVLKNKTRQTVVLPETQSSKKSATVLHILYMATWGKQATGHF